LETLDNSLEIRIVSWFLTALSITGAALNVKKLRISFVYYTVANIGWICVNLYYGIYSQAVLFVVFTGLSIWGWLEWGRIGKSGDNDIDSDLNIDHDKVD
jgi:nicotinamide riboside transporter PnuC